MQHTTRLFGTDGIRGVANTGVLTPVSVLKLGKIIGTMFSYHPWCFSINKSKRGKKIKGKPRVIIARDTRISGRMIEDALVAGLFSCGVDVVSLGVAPTPVLAYLTRKGPYQLGVVISASHNPVADNGIKLIAHEGTKITEAMEHRIEKYFRSPSFKAYRPPLPRIGDFVTNVRQGLDFYKKSIVKSILGSRPSLKGLRVVLDCANGAESSLAPEVLKHLGAKVYAINCRPNGRNINRHCGSLYPEVLQQAVRKYKARAGFSFDGDGDRVMIVDEQGIFRDGDYILAIAARYLKRHERLPKNLVISTIMSNKGLEVSLREKGIKMERTKVGDKYVLEEMLASGSLLGGEQSGHIIFSRYSLAGDGLITALVMLKIMKKTGKRLSQLAQCMDKYPQVLLNVPVKAKPPLDKLRPVRTAMSAAEAALGGDGRISVRYSGTEPLARVMIEGKALKVINTQALKIKKAIQAAI